MKTVETQQTSMVLLMLLRLNLQHLSKCGCGHAHGCACGRERRDWGRQQRGTYKCPKFADIESPKPLVGAEIMEDWRKRVKGIHGLIGKNFDRKSNY